MSARPSPKLKPGGWDLLVAACVAAAALACAAAFSLAGIAAGKLSWRSGIPMAPFLAAWLVGGACACLHGMG